MSDPDPFPGDDQPQDESGEAIRRKVQGALSDRLMDALGELDPAFPDWADRFVFGELWSRPGATFDDRMLVAIVALASTGRTTQLRNYLHGALQAGVPAERIHESLAMLVPYVGFPTTVAAMSVWKSVRDGSGATSDDA